MVGLWSSDLRNSWFPPKRGKKEAWLSAGPPFSCDWSYLLGFSPLVAEIEFSLCCGHRLPI
ncbi:hypothetical protein COLSTE_00051 [Collinsella stercoris DSM 13279]|uniref:Uncharacterized protein n=1 Tax=Collinsella stercoris DSM 13279 TaxID=445975 RepID=B6G7L2_9ACTN|nr:hypothetical protein COLSTE_00051 [Collinsella stercoris DSM 13279]